MKKKLLIAIPIAIAIVAVILFIVNPSTKGNSNGQIKNENTENQEVVENPGNTENVDTEKNTETSENSEAPDPMQDLYDRLDGRTHLSFEIGFLGWEDTLTWSDIWEETVREEMSYYLEGASEEQIQDMLYRIAYSSIVSVPRKDKALDGKAIYEDIQRYNASGQPYLKQEAEKPSTDKENNSTNKEENSSDKDTSNNKKEYTFKELNKTMYAKSSVNLRDLPSTKGDIVGKLSYGQKVTVIARCNETGWYRLEDGDVYVSDAYLISTKPQEQESSSGGQTDNDDSQSNGQINNEFPNDQPDNSGSNDNSSNSNVEIIQCESCRGDIVIYAGGIMADAPVVWKRHDGSYYGYHSACYYNKNCSLCGQPNTEYNYRRNDGFCHKDCIPLDDKERCVVCNGVFAIGDKLGGGTILDENGYVESHYTYHVDCGNKNCGTCGERMWPLETAYWNGIYYHSECLPEEAKQQLEQTESTE